jgi:hypothetical protein
MWSFIRNSLLCLLISSCAFFEKHDVDLNKFKKYLHEREVVENHGKPDLKITDGYSSFFAYEYCPRTRNKQLLWALPTLGGSLYFCPSRRKKILTFKGRRLVNVIDSNMTNYEFMGLAAGISNKIEHDLDEEMTTKYMVLRCGSRFQRELYSKACAKWSPDENDL